LFNFLTLGIARASEKNKPFLADEKGGNGLLSVFVSLKTFFYFAGIPFFNSFAPCKAKHSHEQKEYHTPDSYFRADGMYRAQRI